ncbi:MAG: amidohydrolase [Deltaproteobacteria bacterium]|nr:amidohydrolase [Deltaproteobacteria bacterium]MBW1942415.1 amidohydrolase [Deltaproteobacteria bacterium]
MAIFDIVVANGTVLTMNQENAVINKGYLGIVGDSISQIGPLSEGVPDAKMAIDAKGGLILPGLINGHTHAAMTLFRGLADDLPLMEWLNNYIFPVESKMDGDFVYRGTMLACAEMILSGTTTFCDMYLFEDEVARAAKDAGMRSIVGEVLYDFDSPNYGSLENGFKYTETLIKKWASDPLISIAVEPHALFTCSPDLLQRADALAKKYQVPLIIHLAETLNEIEEVKNRYGVSPVDHLISLGLAGPHLIADHCVHLDDREIALLAGHGVKAVHMPESNMKLASGVSPVPKLLDAEMTVGIGTDGCASNNNLDLFTEMDMAAKLHKLDNMDPTVLDAPTVLKMATIESARALDLDTITGSLEPGKKADVIILDTDKPHLTPMYNPFSHVVYAARGNDVSHSIIHGRLVMEDRRLLTLDLQEVMEKAQEKSREVMDWIAK